jgi:hypothetical protein
MARGFTFAPFAALLLIGAAACGGNSDGGPAEEPDGPTMLNGEKYTATWGPVLVQPGIENTQCAVLTLDNATPIKVHQMRNVLGSASHHMIVYRDDASAPQTTPLDCKPFAGTLTATTATSPIMITQRDEETLTLPDGVAYSFSAHQKIRLEMHFLNATDQPQMITGTAEFYAAYPEQVRNEADFLFIGTPDISLGPASTSTISSYFTPPASLAGSKFFAITGHTHQFGTSVEVSTSPDRAGARTQAIPVERAGDEDAGARLRGAVRRRLRFQVQLPQPHRANRQVRRIHRGRDVLLLGLLLSVEGLARLRAHHAGQPARGRRRLLPGGQR